MKDIQHYFTTLLFVCLFVFLICRLKMTDFSACVELGKLFEG